MNRLFHQRAGFTIIELMVAITILTFLTLFSGQIYLNYTDVSRNLKAGNLVYEEGRFLMERIIREIRQNAIDYEQYFNKNNGVKLYGGKLYTDNYCRYSTFFYDSGRDDDPATWEDNESRGFRNQKLSDQIVTSFGQQPTATKSIENELYLINLNGNQRTILGRVVKEVNGTPLGKLAMLKLIGKDFGDDHINGSDSYNGHAATDDLNCSSDDRENDGLIDTWLCDSDYPCKRKQPLTSTSQPACQGFTDLVVNDPASDDHSFVDISPSAINIVSLRFFISPQDDPWKAYNLNEMQIQPHVTIQLTVAANPQTVSKGNDAPPPSITLTSTISARNYDEIKSDCR